MMQFRRSAFVPHDLKAPLSGRASGPLSGLTVAVKDMYDIAGERVSGGSPAWLAAQGPAAAHSAVVDRILQAGGTIIGKTVCDEFFYSVTGMNAHYGTPVNPRTPGRIPGGSSAGSAAACGAGACDLAIGSDTAGSVRVPAAFCGLYGLRVTHGRIDLRGAMAMAPSFDAGGWFAATPGLFARVGSVLLDERAAVQGSVSKLAWLGDAFGRADARIGELARGFLAQAAAILPAMTEVSAAGEEIDAWREAMRVKQAAEVWQTFGAFVRQHGDQLGPGIAERMRVASEISADDLRKAEPTLVRVRKRMEVLTAQGTLLVLPTCASMAPLTTASATDLDRYRIDTMRLVCMASISGLPQMTIPFATLEGAPVGLSFIGWRGSDEVLLDLALRLARHLT
ncbi:MAG TPA: amidase [Burkholderiales bacterium]|jgi:amidase